MKRLLLVFVVISFVFSGFVFGGSGCLERGFKEVPNSAKPHTWWHWMNENVSREGITADLEAMAEIGIGGAQIFNVADKGSVSIPRGDVPFMSEKWLEMVKHAAEEGERLGIELCLHNCAGWSSSGGPWITPEYSMQEVVYKEVKADGPGKFDKVLPQPTARMDFYRDIAILAFPTPGDDSFRIDDISAKIGVRREYSLDPNLADVPEAACIAMDSIVDLTSKVDGDGRLVWDVPEGSWRILRIGHTTTGKTNHPAMYTGLGLECDKLSREAFDLHWDNAVKPVLDKLGRLAPKVLNNILVDSYEVRHNNWTKKMPKEFKKRKGYDLVKYLPAFAGRVVENAQVSERFLWDFRQVNAALFDENYFGYFADKCHKYGLLASVEPYGGPFEYLAVGGKCDVIMGEYWISSGDRVGLGGSLKIAATTAHTHGKRYVGAESFTSQPHKGRWQNHPASMKVLGDQVYCSGINRFIFHRYAHQLWIDVYPGMTMGQWGTHFDRTNTWWKQGDAWMEYLGRSQFLLQQGKFVGDVVFFMGESVPSSIVADEQLKEAGYDYDLIGTDLIWKVKVKDGLITLPSGMQYELMVLANSDFMTVNMAKRIKKLVKDGARIVGSKPVGSPTLVGYPKSQEKLAVVADQLWGTDGGKKIDRTYGKGKIFAGISALEALKKLGVEPDIIDMSAKKETAFIHRRTKEADIYFVSSRNKKQNTKDFSFRVCGMVPELWDGESGEIKEAPMWQEKDGRCVVTIDFAPCGSMFVVFREKTDKDSSCYTSIKAKIAPKPAKKSTDTLEILKAEYGVFSNTNKRMVDVADKLASMVKDNKLSVKASNDIAGDPLSGQVKHLYVTYSYGGKEYTAKSKEGNVMVLPRADIAGDGKELKILAAIYGRLPDGQSEARVPAVIDITDRVAAKVKDGSINVGVNNDLAGKDPVSRARKQLKVSYVFNGVKDTRVLDEGNWLQIPRGKFEPTAILPEICGKYLKVAENGRYGLTKACGGVKTVNVTDLPEPVEIQGSWKLRFMPRWGGPERVAFDKLISWTEHKDDGVKYYSGTASYYKNFSVGADFVGKGRRVVLDLGEVKCFAEVKVNGTSYDVLWKEPFHVDITDAVRVGNNELEVAVTNLWPNRLIGDEQYEDDCQWSGSALKCWPEWFVKKQQRPSKRFTFATWKHWHKDDKLLRSGLLGPVKLEAVKVIDLED